MCVFARKICEMITVVMYIYIYKSISLYSGNTTLYSGVSPGVCWKRVGHVNALKQHCAPLAIFLPSEQSMLRCQSFRL